MYRIRKIIIIEAENYSTCELKVLEILPQYITVINLSVQHLTRDITK